MQVPYRQEYASSIKAGICELHTGRSILVPYRQEYAGSIQAGVCWFHTGKGMLVTHEGVREFHTGRKEYASSTHEEVSRFPAEIR